MGRDDREFEKHKFDFERHINSRRRFSLVSCSPDASSASGSECTSAAPP